MLGLNESQVKSSFDFPQIPDVVEDKDTLEGNAIKKAMTIASATGCWALADDSGLEVDALGGAPGVYSARYAGEHCSYMDNCNKLLFELDGQTNRRARFRTVLALVNLVGEVRTLEGAMDGVITTSMRGSDGFGYDPVFIPEGMILPMPSWILMKRTGFRIGAGRCRRQSSSGAHCSPNFNSKELSI